MREALLATATRLLGRPTVDPLDLVFGVRAHGCRVVTLEGESLIDLASPGLLGHGHPVVTAALRQAVDAGLPAAAGTALGLRLAERLADLFGVERVVLCASVLEARGLAERVARLATGRTQVTELDAGAATTTSLDKTVAALVFGADLWARAEPADVRAAIAAARHAGALVIADESVSAFRLTAASRSTLLGVETDLTVLGESLAAGLPFGVVMGSARWLDPLGLRWTASPLAIAAAEATLATIGWRPVHARLAEIGERLQLAFRRACATHELAADLVGSPASAEICFAGQENAPGALMLHHFERELRSAGILAGPILRPCAVMTEADVAAAERGLEHALGRLRTLLIEYNSYLSGGLRWAFTTGSAALQQRGLAIYRFPARGPVDVVAAGDSVRITFGPGDLGKVTSSGFYVPTRVRGDFRATVRYRITRWRPGAAFACLALFAQDEASLLRYYAERRSKGDQPPELLANFNNQRLTEPRREHGMQGAFRLDRQGDVVRAWHAATATFELLGEHQGDPARDVIFGVKIWSSGEAFGFEAELTELEIEGLLPDDQLPLPLPRPDPRF